MDEGKGPIRFGVFEADLMSRTLRKRGVRIRLQELPFRLLAMLLARPGEVVTREELKNELWAEDDYGEFDLGLNTAVKKLRQALDDSANTPRFIETIPKVGYRFIGSVAKGDAPAEAVAAPVSSSFRWPPRTWLQLAWIVPAAALAVGLVSRPAPVVDRPVRKWSFAPEGLQRPVAISPNGRHIAYQVRESGAVSIWVRDLDDVTPRKLSGTDARLPRFFSWSPDSQWIAFFPVAQVGEPPPLRKIAITGGSPVTLSELPGDSAGSSWSADGKTIFFAARGRIYEISSAGGEYSILEQLETPKGGLHATPYVLPGPGRGRGLLAVVGARDNYDLVFKNFETGRATVLASGVHPAYSPTGHIVFSETRGGGTLWALPFDLATLQVRGEALRIADFAVNPTVSDDGTLVYVDPGRVMQRLVWIARDGANLGRIGQPQPGIAAPAISSDGRRVAVRATDGGSESVWVHDTDRAVKKRITYESAPGLFPMWSPSDRELLYQAQLPGEDRWGIFRKSADGAGEGAPVFTGEVDVLLDWSRDGRWILFRSDLDGRELRYLNVLGEEGPREPLLFLDTLFHKSYAQFSPDGRFVAYCSDRTGSEEVYISPFPSGEGHEQVSLDGGCQPRWSSDGEELFYVRDDTLLAVKLATTPALVIGAATPLFTHASLTRRPVGASYDVAPDGRFVLIEPAPDADGNVAPSIQVVENWYEEFRDREK